MSESISTPSLLESFGICTDLTLDQREQLWAYLEFEQRDADEWLFHQSDDGDKLFLVVSGSLTAYVQRTDGKELAIAAFEIGSFFGEMALIDGEPRSAGCRAETESRLLSLDRNSFITLKHEHPEIAFSIMRRMLLDTKNRLSTTSAFLSDLVQWGEAARKRAVTDDLTGLYNRRYLDDTVESLVESIGREGGKFSLVMIDLDRFSSINDEYGQGIGDEVLKAVVEVFKAHLRTGDIAARYGGDEFNIIFPKTAGIDALDICNTLCEKVADLDVLVDAGGSITQVTTSQGIATFPDDGKSTESIREAADAAVYRAKEAGKNCVVHASIG